MYKCRNKECNFTISDSFLSFGGNVKIETIIKNNICPECKHKLVYINEILEMYNKYKKHMK